MVPAAAPLKDVGGTGGLGEAAPLAADDGTPAGSDSLSMVDLLPRRAAWWARCVGFDDSGRGSMLRVVASTLLIGTHVSVLLWQWSLTPAMPPRRILGGIAGPFSALPIHYFLTRQTMQGGRQRVRRLRLGSAAPTASSIIAASHSRAMPHVTARQARELRAHEVARRMWNGAVKDGIVFHTLMFVLLNGMLFEMGFQLGTELVLLHGVATSLYLLVALPYATILRLLNELHTLVLSNLHARLVATAQAGAARLPGGSDRGGAAEASSKEEPHDSTVAVGGGETGELGLLQPVSSTEAVKLLAQGAAFAESVTRFIAVPLTAYFALLVVSLALLLVDIAPVVALAPNGVKLPWFAIATVALYLMNPWIFLKQFFWVNSAHDRIARFVGRSCGTATVDTQLPELWTADERVRFISIMATQKFSRVSVFGFAVTPTLVYRLYGLAGTLFTALLQTA